MTQINYVSRDAQSEALQRAFFAASMRKRPKDRSKIYKKVTASSNIFTIPEECVFGQLSALSIQGNTVNSIIKNGNFANGTTDWPLSGTATLSAANNVLNITGNGTSMYPQTVQVTSIPSGRKYYKRLYARITTAYTGTAYIGYTIAGTTSGSKAHLITNPTVNQWYDLSEIVDTATFVGNLRFTLYHQYADAATANGKVLEVKEVMAIDMGTSVADNPLYSLTAADMNTRFPTWLKYGIVSTQPARVRAVGKNLFDKKLFINKSTKSNATTSETSTGVKVTSTSDGQFRRAYMTLKLEPNVQYKIQRDLNIISGAANSLDARIGVLDATTTITLAAIGKTIPNGTQVTFTVPSDGIVYLYLYATFDISGSGEVEFNNVQITKGDSVFEQYTETVAYTPAGIELRSLPNGIKDEVNFLTGVYTKNVSNPVILNGSESWFATDTTLTNTILFTLPISDRQFGVLNVATDRFITKEIYTLDEEGIRGFAGNNNIGIRILKSKLSTQDAAGFKTWLAANPTTLFYQLTVPVVQYFDPFAFSSGPLEVGPGYTITFEPACFGVKKPALGSGKIVITTSDKQIKEVKRVIRFDVTDNGQTQFTDVTASATITDSGTSITITGADYTKSYFYDSDYVDGINTVPVVDIEYPIGEDQTGYVATHDYGAAAATWALSGEETKATMLVCTNAGGTASIIGPNTPGKPYIVRNTSGQVITIKTATGTGVAIANGKTAMVVNSGTDYVRITADA